MAAPVLSPFTSILKATVGQPFDWQPTASNLPKPPWMIWYDLGSGGPEPWGVEECLLQTGGAAPLVWPVGSICYPVGPADAYKLNSAFYFYDGHYDPDPTATGEGQFYTKFQTGKPLVLSSWLYYPPYTTSPVISLKDITGAVVTRNAGAAGMPILDKIVSLAFSIWEIVGLPEGITYSPITGRVYGTPIAEGAGMITITVATPEGSSSYSVPFGVESSRSVAVAGASVSTPLTWDLDTGVVTGPGEGAYTGPRELAQVAGGGRSDEPEVKPAQLVIRSETKPPISIRIREGGAVKQLALSELVFAVKEVQTEPKVDLNDGALLVAGAGPSTAYEIILDASKVKLNSILSNYEDDQNSGVYAFAELRAKMLYDDGDSIEEIPIRSRSFYVRLESSF